MNIKYIDDKGLTHEEKLELLKRIKNDNIATKEDIDNNIQNNIPLYYLGQPCIIKKSYTEFGDKNLIISPKNNFLDIYVSKVYKNKIQLSNNLLNILINEIDSIDISWILLTSKQIKKYGYLLPMIQIFRFYTENNMTENFIKNLISTNKYYLKSLVYSEIKLSINFLNWLLKHEKLSFPYIKHIVEFQQLSEEFIIKHLSLFSKSSDLIDLILEKQNLPENIKNQLKIAYKLL